ncbi:5ea435f5-16b9-42c7-8f09-028bf1730c68 [Thermothielavioides terrestris]|uniref:5ea435f5-16b9-42c7-8f09-028bf1730c68 n=1 Tax=Thermothielavioides terrestris TaxID=2587410 RepID=A0A3S4BGD7_9PEZI|nr:5ea435f5-16b9-42c7-8f09-028bf1730c68 [Thermothielavioides terrestris]
MASRGSQQQQQGEAVDLASLSAQQLSAVKKQLDGEVEHLSASYAQLAAAQAKFKECLRIVKSGSSALDKDKPILVPLTNSLYVKGQLSDPDRVLVDVGTGYYDTKSAAEFYDAKIKELAGNIQGLEGIVQAKTNNLRVVEEVQ